MTHATSPRTQEVETFSESLQPSIFSSSHASGDNDGSVTVNAQGDQHAINHLAVAAGFSNEERHWLIHQYASIPRSSTPGCSVLRV